MGGTDTGIEWSLVNSVAPRTLEAVVRDRLDDEQRVRESFLPIWGLQRSWAKEKGPQLINARPEGVATNGMLRSVFASTRSGARRSRSSSVPGDAAGEVHDRMPAFLTPAAWDSWLPLEKVDKVRAHDLLDLLDVDPRAVAATLRTHPASRAVNNVRTLDRHKPDLIIPVQSPCQGRHSVPTESLGACRPTPVPRFAIGSVAVLAWVAGCSAQVAEQVGGAGAPARHEEAGDCAMPAQQLEE